MYKSTYKQTFIHTCIEFNTDYTFRGSCGHIHTCIEFNTDYTLWQIFSVDFRGISFYFRYIGVSSYCSHRDHCVHADQQSDQILSASVSQLKSNEAIVLVKKLNEAIVLVKIKPIKRKTTQTKALNELAAVLVSGEKQKIFYRLQVKPLILLYYKVVNINWSKWE